MRQEEKEDIEESVYMEDKIFNIESREEFPPLDQSIQECTYNFSFIDEEGKISKEDILFLGKTKEDINVENVKEDLFLGKTNEDFDLEDLKEEILFVETGNKEDNNSENVKFKFMLEKEDFKLENKR